MTHPITDDLAENLQARAPVQGEPVYWEWRHLSTHPDTVDFGKWSEWKRVEARSAIHTIDDELAEFRTYIAQGHKYELRALYTTPQPAQATQAVPMAWTCTAHRLPKVETPVLILHAGKVRIGELRWDYPGYEDTYQAYRYWDDPEDDGQAWEWNDVTHWMPLPALPESTCNAILALRPERVPMTDEEATTMIRETVRGNAIRREGSTSLQIVRATEAYYGIKPKEQA